MLNGPRVGYLYGRRRAGYLLFLSILVIMVSSIDRSILSLLVEPIRKDFGATDFEMSLLGGLAFSLFYAICAIPLGRVVDSGNRPLILAAGILLWSIATGMSGLATTFAALFVCRVFVAVGEAVASPTTIGMAADIYWGRGVGRVVAIVMIGAILGPSVALIGGGFILQMLEGREALVLLGLSLHPWQIVLLISAVPGILLSPLIFFTLHDPMRKRVTLDADGKPLRPSFAEFARFLRENRAAVLAQLFGYSVFSLGDRAIGFWAPTFLVRQFDFDVAEAGYIYGTLALIVAVGGIVGVGSLVDRANAAGRLDAPIRIARNGALLGIAPTALFPLIPYPWLSIGVLMLGQLCASSYATITMVQALFTPNQVRAQYQGMYLLVSNLIAGVIGTSLVAVVTEVIIGDRAMIGYSLSIVGGGGFALAALILSLGLKPYAESARRIGMMSDTA